jgi:hypothetical protein
MICRHHFYGLLISLIFANFSLVIGCRLAVLLWRVCAAQPARRRVGRRRKRLLRQRAHGLLPLLLLASLTLLALLWLSLLLRLRLRLGSIGRLHWLLGGLFGGLRLDFLCLFA